MKLVTDRTDAIIVNAQFCGDGMPANFALLSIDNDFINAAKKEKERAWSLKHEAEHFRFSKLTFFGDAVCWFDNDKLKLADGKNWSYIEIIEEEIDALDAIQQPEAGTINFDAEGFFYMGYDDQNNEYFTSKVNPDEL